MAENSTLVSIVIPSYNRARFVVKAIDSVLAQTYGNREIIVVDSSTDETAEVLKPYLGRIRYFYQERAGISAARNYGIREARGKWIALLDSDDEWTPRRLEAAMMAVQDRPDLVAHFTNMEIYVPGCDPVNLFVSRGLPQRGEDSWVLERPLLEQLKYQFCFSSNSFARRQAILDAGLFDEQLTIHEDLDLFFRLAMQGPWAVSGDVMARLIRRDEDAVVNLSRQSLDRPVYSQKCLLKVFQKLAALNGLNIRERALVREKLSGARFDLALAQLREGYISDGRKTLYRSFSDHPSPKALVKVAVVRLLGRYGVSWINNIRSRRTTAFRRSSF